MTNDKDLPPLPVAMCYFGVDDEPDFTYFTADQMRAYARQAVAEALAGREGAVQTLRESADATIMRTALERIARWVGEFPESGRFYDGRPMSYGAAFGSNGERDYMRQLAASALSAPSAPAPDQGDLEPCPFCGHIGLDFADGSTYRWGIASCGGCGATCGEVRRENPDTGAWHAKAIADWNTRAALAAQPIQDSENEARRAVGKWLNEEPNRPIDKVAVAQLCAAFDSLSWRRSRGDS